MRRGFTLMELMIVIAVIAIIAALAIPGLVSSQRAGNERSAFVSIKTLASANIDFKSNDRDVNGVNDFWTGDVSGLYRLTAGAAIEPIKMIEMATAGMDGSPIAAAGAGGKMGGDLSYQPKAGYWLQSLETDQDPEPDELYKVDTGGSVAMGAVHNLSRYGFTAYPDAYGVSGRLVYIMNEVGSVLQRDPVAPVTSSSTPPKAIIPAWRIFPANPGTAGWGKID